MWGTPAVMKGVAHESQTTTLRQYTYDDKRDGRVEDFDAGVQKPFFQSTDVPRLLSHPRHPATRYVKVQLQLQEDTKGGPRFKVPKYIFCSATATVIANPTGNALLGCVRSQYRLSCSLRPRRFALGEDSTGCTYMVALMSR